VVICRCCLDLCRNSNVIGVSDGRSGERSVTWFGGILLRSETDAMVRFLAAGGALPAELHGRRFAAARPFPELQARARRPRRRGQPWGRPSHSS
jgi:hypothetical protein